MLRLPLPLLSANRMRRNTDVSQEKGVKQECFTFQRNQADKKEVRRKPAKQHYSVTLGERAWTQAEKLGAGGFPGARKHTLTEFRRAAKRLPAGED